jgi:hypothetical protein
MGALGVQVNSHNIIVPRTTSKFEALSADAETVVRGPRSASWCTGTVTVRGWLMRRVVADPCGVWWRLAARPSMPRTVSATMRSPKSNATRSSVARASARNSMRANPSTRTLS